MANLTPPGEEGLPPGLLLLAGLGVLGVTFLWNGADPEAAPAWRAGAIAAGLLLVGIALWRQLPPMLADTESRLAAAGLWALGVASCVVAHMALPASWDSLGVPLRLLGLAASAAALLTAVPPALRHGLISLMVVAHFSAIFCAITVVPPPGGPPPFLSARAYVHWFHPYLSALNLTNGYHFYAPEPGPCAVTFFRVCWADGAVRWTRIPDHAAMRDHLERRRHGALATILTQTGPPPPMWTQELIDRRIQTGEKHTPPIPPADGPMPPQYREPTAAGRMLLSSFVRRVARQTPHPAGGDAAVESVKVYVSEYFSPPVEHFHAGGGPIEPTMYAAYYMGTYGPEGGLKDPVGVEWELGPDNQPRPKRGKDGKVVVVQDPFLFWRLPIMRVDDDRPPPDPEAPPPAKPAKWSGRGRLVNCVLIHAGDREGMP